MVAQWRLITLHTPLLLLFVCFLASTFQAEVAAAKRKSVPIKPPDLRIVTVTASPDAYTAGDGAVEFNVEVELPMEFEEGSLLEVSLLINSPSMSSMRFLSVRQPVPLPSSNDSIPGSTTSMKPRVSVTLAWDGMDQAKQQVEGGRYHYETRAKLLTVRENVPRTLMNAWPKRGSLSVK